MGSTVIENYEPEDEGWGIVLGPFVPAEAGGRREWLKMSLPLFRCLFLRLRKQAFEIHEWLRQGCMQLGDLSMQLGRGFE
jgi:hypothetical protein